MATISFGAQGAARSITQEGGYRQKAGLLAPHMVKATLIPDANDTGDNSTTKVLRVLPSYACDTWEVFIVLGANDPKVRVYGLDDDYAGSGIPTSGTKYELTELKDIGPYNSGFVSTHMPQNFIIDRAWQGLQFDVTEETGTEGNASVTIKVKAYRSGQCTFEGSYTTGTVENS